MDQWKDSGWKHFVNIYDGEMGRRHGERKDSTPKYLSSWKALCRLMHPSTPRLHKEGSAGSSPGGFSKLPKWG